MKKKIQLKKEVISQLDDARSLQIKGGTAATTMNCPESDAYGNVCYVTGGNGATCCNQFSGCKASEEILCDGTRNSCRCEIGKTEPVVCATGGYTAACMSNDCISSPTRCAYQGCYLSVDYSCDMC